MQLDQEILTNFRTESLGLLDELEVLVEDLENAAEGSVPEAVLKEFSQKIDRIMGAAKTLQQFAPSHAGIAFIANVSGTCKSMGYQAAALRRANLIPIFAGFWAETVETLRETLTKLDSEEASKTFVAAQSGQLEKRLAWLSEKVAPGNEAEKQKVLALLKGL